MSTNGQNEYVLQAEDLRKDLQMGEVTVHALRNVTLAVRRGEFLGIVGPSGSGKSTLLGLIGGLDTPTSGKVYIDGVDITAMSERELTRIRNEKIGFVFQFFNLVPTLTALENVSLPIQFAHKKQFDPTTRAKELLELFELGDRMHHRPAQLSGGQQQRVALARALANNPPLLLGDEPTGNLDSASSEVVMNALREVQRSMNTTVILVTHNMDVASRMDRLITLVDGHIAEDIDPRSTAARTAIKLIQDKRGTGELPVLQLDDVGSTGTVADDVRLDAARELLLQKKYDEARAILEGMPKNKMAQKWLEQIGQSHPGGQQQ